ncbi:MAG: diapophytoene dehydrogenase [Draconibacterium sp.]|nr:MAG: diapophytoene dehydrogenase [Draconibacterium sp.]
MANFEIVMPKLGESIQEGTITKWFVKEGDTIEEDDVLFEVATDKVDSEIPSPVDGVVTKIFFEEDSLVPVGQVLAIVNMGGEDEDTDTDVSSAAEEKKPAEKEEKEISDSKQDKSIDESRNKSNRFYSPLVKSIAKEEGISLDELESIAGSGQNGRVQKKDILNYIENKGKQKASTLTASATVSAPTNKAQAPKVKVGDGDEVVEMDRMRKLIAEHMVMSKSVSPHVTSVIEADVTNIVIWRKKNKDAFQEKYGEKITYMPIFMEAAAKALAEYPWVNSSVDGDKIILHKNINLGIAVARPDGNLIVPVVKNAEQKNLVGLAKDLNGLADAARNNNLTPDDIQGGTFTITNFGSFQNIIGTPIINQPQVAILATGMIEKKPAVLETPTGDVIAIRHKMYLSMSYDHRIIDGALGGKFLLKIKELLENFDVKTEI